VSLRRRFDWRRARALGIGMLILSVVHVPLPQADYHNIRHHDQPGELCVYHDHLLRWHPSADFNDDVALLHWHWFVPLIEVGDQHQRSNDEHHRPGSGPALHAHVGDSLEPDWQNQPEIGPDRCGRLLAKLALELSGLSSADFSGQLAIPGPDSGRFSASNFDSADGLRAARTVLFQRWNC
jgi:hypothetical protein